MHLYITELQRLVRHEFVPSVHATTPIIKTVNGAKFFTDYIKQVCKS